MEPDTIVPSWDETFMSMARVIARRSKDPVTKAGAVVVDDRNVVIGMGYNGWPRGIAVDDLPWAREGLESDTKYAYVVHAERNALYNTSLLPRGCRLYCTLFPCNECAKTIIQLGVTEVIFANDKYHDDQKWIAARRLFDLAGVIYRQREYKQTHRRRGECAV